MRFRALSYDAERPKQCNAISGDSPQPYPKDQSGLVRDKPTAESFQETPVASFQYQECSRYLFGFSSTA